MAGFDYRQAFEIREAFARHFPVCHIDDIIASKAAANRRKDRESLDRLRAFREYWLRNRGTGSLPR